MPNKHGHDRIERIPDKEAGYARLAFYHQFLCTLVTPEPVRDWSLTSLKEKQIRIGAKVVSYGRYIAFQMAGIAIPRSLFAGILRLIAELRPPPDPLLA